MSVEIHWLPWGLVVLDVNAGSDADRAGIRAGELVTRIDGEATFDAVELEVKLETGDEHVLEVANGTEPPREVTLRAGPNGLSFSAFPPIGAVALDGAASRAGIAAGSRVTKLGDEPIADFAAFSEAIQKSEIGTKAIEWVDATGATRRGNVEIAEVRESTAAAIPLETESVEISSDGVLHSFELGAWRVVHIGRQVFSTLLSLIRRDVSAKNLSGPIGITHVFTRAAEDGLSSLIYFMALVSVNLGLLNLLPFPILDGGHLLFLLIEKIKGSPVSIKAQEVATTIAFFLIIALFLFVTFHDIRRALPF
jgi:regulator of sigma E protease